MWERVFERDKKKREGESRKREGERGGGGGGYWQCVSTIYHSPTKVTPRSKTETAANRVCIFTVGIPKNKNILTEIEIIVHFKISTDLDFTQIC